MYDDTTTLIVTWVILAGVVGWIASARKRDFMSFFVLSVLLSPLIGLIVLLTTGHGEPRAPCWRCKEAVIVGAAVCHHCGAELVWPEKPANP
jgi:hypothetical protein